MLPFTSVHSDKYMTWYGQGRKVLWEGAQVETKLYQQVERK